MALSQNASTKFLLLLFNFITMTDYTMFTAMPVNEFVHLIKQTVKDSMKNELTELINSSKAQPEELMTIEEASKFLHVSKVTVHKWKKNKLIKAYRIGRKIYFKKHELIEAMNLKTKNLTLL
jgi:excisionase family DNA binding protein